MFYFVFEGNFRVQAPPPPRGGGLILFWRGELGEGFLHYKFGQLTMYIWRGLYMEGLIFWILRYLLELEKNNYLFVGIFSLAIKGVKVLSLQKLLCVT